MLARAAVVTAGLAAALAALGLQVATSDPPLDLRTAAVAALVVVAAESAFGALEPPVRVRSLRLRLRRAAVVAATAAGAGLVAAFVLVAAGAEVATGLAVELLGVGAAVGALGLVAYLAAAAREER